MGKKRIGFVFGPLILILMSACGPATATPTPTAFLKANNSGPAAGAIAANPPNPVACNPPVPSIVQVTSFCANKSAGLGGVTVVLNASSAYIGGQICSADTTNGFKLTCSGPQSQSITIESCGSCGSAGVSPLSPVFAKATCSKYFERQPAGFCGPTAGEPDYSACPFGSHYDNDQQYCLDDVTQQKLADLCPAGTVTYLPDYHYCLPNSYPERYNCQTFNVPLGVCTNPKKSGQCPPGQTFTCTPMTPICYCK